MFEIPRSTLHDDATGHIEHGVLPGPSPYLAKDKEEELTYFVNKMCKHWISLHTLLGYGNYSRNT